MRDLLYMLWTAPLPIFIETLIKEHGLVATASLQSTVIFCCWRKKVASISAEALKLKLVTCQWETIFVTTLFPAIIV